MRPAADILLDIEPLVAELIADHDLQWGDLLGLLYAHLMVHHPEAREEYVEGGHPRYYYGPTIE